MRYLAPIPKSARNGTVDGYQLCARCGEVLVAGDNAVIVPRSPSWLIYTHPHQCSRNAVHGWKVVLQAERIRDLENVPAPRPAFDYFLLRPCVCLLDEKHIKAELSLVDFSWSGERTTKSGDIREVLEHKIRRDHADGYATLLSEDYDSESPDLETEVNIPRRCPILRNYVEASLVSALDSPGGLKLDWALQEIQRLRAKSYATGRALAAHSEECTYLWKLGKPRRLFTPGQPKYAGRPMFIFGALKARRPPPKRDPIPFKTQEELTAQGRLQELLEKQLIAANKAQPRHTVWPASHRDRPELYLEIKPKSSGNGSVLLFNPIILALLQARPATVQATLLLLNAFVRKLDDRGEKVLPVPLTYSESGSTETVAEFQTDSCPQDRTKTETYDKLIPPSEWLP